MRVTLALFAITAIVARPDEAAACSCMGPRISISPSGTGAPINSTIVVWLPNEDPEREVVLSLRKKSNGETIAVDYKSLGSGEVKVVEMTPRSKLDPNTAYEIVRTDRQADVRGDRYTDRAIGELTTGMRELAATAPAFKGLAKTGYYRDRKVCCNCSTGDPYAVLDLAEPVDDKKQDVRFGIWLAGADGKIDYQRPPITYTRGTRGLWLGHPSTCAPANFTFPKHKALKLGVKLFDLAGNASTPRELVLDTTRPAKHP